MFGAVVENCVRQFADIDERFLIVHFYNIEKIVAVFWQWHLFGGLIDIVDADTYKERKEFNGYEDKSPYGGL
jgi:hypothetical protein